MKRSVQECCSLIENFATPSKGMMVEKIWLWVATTPPPPTCVYLLSSGAYLARAKGNVKKKGS